MVTARALVMAIFHLDDNYSASFVPYRTGAGYVAKGTIMFHGMPVKIFEAEGLTLPIATRAAWVKAEEIVAQLKAQARKAPKKRPAKKR